VNEPPATFRALLAEQDGDDVRRTLRELSPDDLPEGDVTVRVAWSSVNYAPVMTVGVLLILAIWWSVSAKNWFKGPVQTIDEAVVEAFDD